MHIKRKWAGVVVGLLPGVLALAIPVAAAPGMLVPSFGSGGRAEGPAGNSAGVIGLAAQPNGDILGADLVGEDNYHATSPGTRFTPTGTVDPSFAAFPGRAGVLTAGPVVMGDGRVVLATGSPATVS